MEFTVNTRYGTLQYKLSYSKIRVCTFERCGWSFGADRLGALSSISVPVVPSVICLKDRLAFRLCVCLWTSSDAQGHGCIARAGVMKYGASHGTRLLRRSHHPNRNICSAGKLGSREYHVPRARVPDARLLPYCTKDHTSGDRSLDVWI